VDGDENAGDGVGLGGYGGRGGGMGAVEGVRGGGHDGWLDVLLCRDVLDGRLQIVISGLVTGC